MLDLKPNIQPLKKAVGFVEREMWCIRKKKFEGKNRLESVKCTGKDRLVTLKQLKE
jgi:hypothetical protein